MRHDTHQTGRMAEIECERFFTSLGHAVSYPTTEERYDMIVDTDGELYRVQVKSAWEGSRDKIRVEFRAGWTNVPYEDGDVDGFAIYNPIHDEIYWLWPDEVPDGGHTGRNRENWLPHAIEHVFD